MASPDTSLLNLDPEQFVAALDELGIQGEQRAFLEEQYFAQQRALPMTERPEGRRVGTILPMSFPQGMTGAEALMSGEVDFAVPELLRGIYEAPAEAVNVAGATARGVPVSEQQMQEAASGAAEVFTGLGPTTFAARSLVRGVEMPDPNTVSMSGARGMGDNGGPPIQPTRYINPNTGLYSPSYEAAKTLPQEVGTPQQMRAMLLKGGAKEEELLYSGFDEWLKGRGDKVTKQEIEEVLGAAAAGVDGTPLYVRQPLISGGVTGVQDLNFESLQDRVIQDMRRQAIEERDTQLEAALTERGYRPVQFADEAEYRQVADRVISAYANALPGGLMPDGSRVPPARILNTVNDIDRRMQRYGATFDDPEIQLRLRRLADDYDYVLGPNGLPEHTDEVVRRELPDFATNPYYGSLPMSTVDQIQERVYGMSEQELADLMGVDVEDMLQNFRPDETQYGSYAPAGLRNYTENLFKFDDAGRGVLSGVETLGAGRFANPHFANSQGQKAPIMFHTRTGELQTPEGVAYHVAEIQSDIGQTYRKEPGRFVVPGTEGKGPTLDKAEKATLQNYVDVAKRFKEASDAEANARGRMYDEYLDDFTGALVKDAPGYAEAAEEVRKLTQERSLLGDQVSALENDNWDLLYGKLVNAYQTPRTYSNTPIEEFDPKPWEDILAGRAKPKSTLSGKNVALPFATSTNRWVDAALKNEIVAAATRGSEWITFPLGKDVEKYTYGEEAGQQEFYEKIVPTRLKELSKRFLDGAEVQRIKARGFGPNAPEYEVNAIRLTPELRAKLLEGGLPSFAKGGPVSGSSLDVDVFALP